MYGSFRIAILLSFCAVASSVPMGKSLFSSLNTAAQQGIADQRPAPMFAWEFEILCHTFKAGWMDMGNGGGNAGSWTDAPESFRVQRRSTDEGASTVLYTQGLVSFAPKELWWPSVPDDIHPRVFYYSDGLGGSMVLEESGVFHYTRPEAINGQMHWWMLRAECHVTEPE